MAAHSTAMIIAHTFMEFLVREKKPPDLGEEKRTGGIFTSYLGLSSLEVEMK